MEYHLKSIGKTCAGSGAPLAPGSACWSVLVHRGGELARLDYSESAWQGPPENTAACWKTTVPAAPAGKQPLDPDALMRSFEQLCEERDPGREQLRYALALLLLRKRRLELEGTRTDGDDEILQLVATRGEGTFQIRNLELDAAQLDRLQSEFGAAESSPIR